VEYSGSAKLASFKQFMVYSKRPLLVEEIAEVITLDVNDDSYFDSVRQLPDSRAMLSVLPNLVTTVLFTNNEGSAEETSSKGALFSPRIPGVRPNQRQSSKTIRHQEERANAGIAETCLQERTLILTL
jgi:hypothetical protein